MPSFRFLIFAILGSGLFASCALPPKAGVSARASALSSGEIETLIEISDSLRQGKADPEWLEVLDRIGPEVPEDIHLLKGILLFRLYRFREAEAVLRRVAETLPGDAYVHNLLGVVRLFLGRPDAAVVPLSKAKSAVQIANSNLCMALLLAGDLEGLNALQVKQGTQGRMRSDLEILTCAVVSRLNGDPMEARRQLSMLRNGENLIPYFK